MAAKANKEISVNHEGRQKFIDLLAGNAFTLAYVATQIRAEFSTFDDNYELQYVPPGETSYYSIDSDKEMMRALNKFEEAKTAVKLTTTKKKTSASGPLPAQPSVATSAAMEGVNIDDPLTLPRTELCEKVHQQLQGQRAVLLRSPPMSGKSSLARLLLQWYRKTHPEECIIVVSLVNVSMLDLATAEKDFKARWLTAAGFEFDALTSNDHYSRSTTIVVDEAQRAYEEYLHDFSLWRYVKFLQQGDISRPQQPYPAHRLLCLSGYTPALLAGGRSTPVKFPPTAILQLEDMQLRPAEQADLFGRLAAMPASSLVIGVLPERVRKYISNATCGHAGIMRLYVAHLLDTFKDERARANEDDMLAAVVGTKFIEKVATQRIFPETATTDQQRLLSELVNRGKALPLAQHARRDAALALAKQGMLVVRGEGNSEEVDFSAPVTRQVALWRFTACAPSGTEPPSSLVSLIEDALMRFDASQLCASLTRSADDPSMPVWEAQWQSTFYAATVGLLPPGTVILPEVGKIFDADGRVDFIIDSNLCWGVELTRNGSRLNAHLARFEPGGIYHGLVAKGKVKDWVVLDFCLKAPSQQPQDARVWHLVYDQGYTKVTIHRHGRHPYVINFLGAQQQQLADRVLPPAAARSPPSMSAPLSKRSRRSLRKQG